MKNTYITIMLIVEKRKKNDNQIQKKGGIHSSNVIFNVHDFECTHSLKNMSYFYCSFYGIFTQMYKTLCSVFSAVNLKLKFITTHRRVKYINFFARPFIFDK